MAASLDIKAAAKFGYLGGTAAGLIGVGLYYVGLAMGATFRPKNPEDMGGLEMLLPFQPLLNCLVAATLALGILALLHKLTPARAWPIFVRVAVVAFVLEGYAPFWAFDDTTTIVILEFMHIPATIGIVWGLGRGRLDR